MPEVKGIDTIGGLVGEPPMGIHLDRRIVEAQQRLMPLWSSNYIAIIPYCFKCKKPLVWHTAPREDNIMFHCPKCMRVWMMESKTKNE